MGAGQHHTEVNSYLSAQVLTKMQRAVRNLGRSHTKLAHSSCRQENLAKNCSISKENIELSKQTQL
jgi:hypothetical protein